MASPPPEAVTRLLRAWSDGDQTAPERLLPLVDAELRRRGHTLQTTLVDAIAEASMPDLDVIALDRALDRLSEIDERKVKVIELRFFAGLSVEEAADVLHVSGDTIKRDWRLAKMWLLRELTGGES